MLNKFLTNYPFGNLTEEQKTAIQSLIHKLKFSSIQIPKQQAYVLATIKHETADTYRPIKELGSLIYLQKKPYYPFIGRGFVQLTWRVNYEVFGKLLQVDLVNNMDLALDPEISWKICELGMSRGLFTGKSLNDYFNDKESDWYHARKIINKLDKAELIAGYAEKIYSAINDFKKELVPSGVE